MSEQEEDFAAMFEASVKTRRFSRGQAIEGTIVAIGPDTSLVNVGGKGEAVIETADLKDHENDLEFAVGDRIQAIVVGTTGASPCRARASAARRRCSSSKTPTRRGCRSRARSRREVKGGYEVRIAGQRGFCPFSQIDTVRTADPGQHVGKTYAFRIIEFKEGGKNLVVSRRALLEDEQKAGAAVLRQSIAVGDTVTGRVASVREFGAFVDLGAGVQGLLHVSEMGWSRVTDPVVHRQGRRRDHRARVARRQRRRAHRAGPEAADGRPVGRGGVELRSGAGQDRPHHPHRRLWRVRRARARGRSARALLDLCPDRPRRRLERVDHAWA